MSSFLLHKLHVSWEKQRVLMIERHDDECTDFKRERDARRNAAIEKCQLQLEILRNTVPSAVLEEEQRKVRRDRDNEVAVIQKEYSEGLRVIKEIQRKEKLNHDTAYHDAIAVRSSRTGPWLSPTVPIAATAHTGQAIDGASSRSSPRSATGFPRKDVIIPTRNGPVTKPREILQAPKATRSYARQPHRVDTSVDPLRTPTPTVSAADDLNVQRTVTFAEVYQNGEAAHKDTIIEFPQGSDQWYILKCEEHQQRFTQRVLQGATKHLNGRDHGNIDRRQRTLAIKMLGYRVLGCNRQLAEVNNKVVQRAFANGYVPMGVKRPSQSVMAAKLNSHSKRGTDTDGTTFTNKIRRARGRPPRNFQKQSRTITNPKTYHVYYCYWHPEKCMYPVLILGWNDQKQGGLKHNLAGTGLLDKKKSSPPNCYIYEATEDGIYGSIIAWAPGFEDGGSKVHWRKFPVMFFDKVQSVSWVAARSLSRFPLFKTDAPSIQNHPFNAARRWIAKQAGFSSWEAFERARKPQNLESSSLMLSPEPTSEFALEEADDNAENGSDKDSTNGDSDMGSPSSSSSSNVTEKELQALLEKGGDMSDDSDYAVSAESDVESSLEDESKAWAHMHDEPSKRPWAFYSLRNTGNTKKEEPSKSAKDGSNKTLSRDDSSKVLEEIIVKDDDDNLLSNASWKDTHVATTTEQVNSQPQTAAAIPTTNDSSSARPSAAESKRTQTPTGEKRARSEGDMETCTPGQGIAKKARFDTNTLPDASSDEKAETSAVQEPMSTHVPRAESLFKPKLPLEPAGFELICYEKESISWAGEGEMICAKLYYGESDMTVGAVDGPVDIVIDPTTLEGFKRQEIPGSKGNSIMTLLSKGSDEKASMRLVFDRTKGSKAEIGKIQVRSFIRWLRSVNPSLRLLED
ncbi:hypothetical protein GGS21DRAFT_513456 [Xylaria nigripes]|nr:hypothetical protein GGS21DRAFT_513456 [Xylaria nigripes]